MIRFPYSYRRQQLFPIIPVTINLGSYEVTTDALVDSGANISVFRQEIADCLGLQIESGEETLLHGLGGRVVGYIHKVELIVEQVMFPCKVVFSSELTVGINILGRQDFFEKFKITFDEMNKELHLESY
jgi:hypothetical protein